jgi:hypothetical protein
MNQTNPYVVVLATNLATFSQIQHAAQAHGYSVLWGQSIGNTLQKIPAGAKVGFLVVDLSDDRYDCAEIHSLMTAQHPEAALVAFGPHVHETRLNKAVEAGFQQVMPRSRFFHILGDLFA